MGVWGEHTKRTEFRHVGRRVGEIGVSAQEGNDKTVHFEIAAAALRRY